MTVSQIGTGTVAIGSTSVAPAYPTGVAANRVAVLKVAAKPNTATIVVPSGYTSLASGTGGTGTQAADTGAMAVRICYRLLTGAETGTLTVSVTSGNSSSAVLDIYSSTLGFATGQFGGTTGGDATHGTAWSTTMGTTLAFNPTTAGLLIGCSACTSDVSASITSRAVSATGATFGSVANARAAANITGNDSLMDTFDFPVLTGTATAAAVYTATHGASNSGVTAIVRLTEVPGGFRAQAPYVVGQEAIHRATRW